MIKTLKLPSSLLPDNYWDFIFPERLIVFHNKEVFIFDEEEEALYVYKEKL